jgi:hypothetical protein
MNNKKKENLNRIFSHNKALENIGYKISNNDCEGYIYCIENSFFEGYSQDIYKIGGTQNIEKMIKESNTYYLTETKIIKTVKVPKKSFFEYLIMLRLHKYRIKAQRNFYINKEEINKAFDELEFLITNKNLNDKEEFNKIQDYYLRFIKNFDNNKYCKIKLEINKTINNITDLCINKNKIYKNNLNIENAGYVYWLEQPYIKKYFNEKVQILIPSLSINNPWKKSKFLEDVEIIKVFKLNNFGMGKYMFYELTHINNITSHYYQISKDEIINIFNLINKYFNTYSDKIQLNFAFNKRVL